jgi:adenylate cyclase
METDAAPDAAPARRALRAASPESLEKPRRPASLQDRIVVFFVVLLMSVQLASFYLIRYAIGQTAQNTLRQELNVGARVFRRLLDQNSQQLVEATSVLTYDFGFREAIASRDRATILSALTNHAARIKASGMAVIGLDGMVVSDTLHPDGAERPYPFADVIENAAARGRTSAVRVVDGKPYQIVVVPVLAPLPIAWTSMSFVIDNTVARELQSLTLSDVTFLEVTPSGSRMLATTVPPSRHEALLAAVPAILAAKDGLTVSLGKEDFEMLAARLEGSGPTPLVAILQRSVAEGLQPYFVLQVLLLFLAGLSLTVTLVGAIRLARRITEPVAELAAAAREIERGNYAVSVDVTGSYEIGELARAFDGMTRGLAERDNMRDVLGKVASTAVVDQFLTGQIELGGEERDATVMFTDVRNFTALAERMTPTQSLGLLNEFLTEISEIVEAHGGVIDKYMGDGVMALFGAPVSRPDDALRALRAAIAVRDGVRAMGPRLAARGMPQADVGVGLNTSRVIAGNIGSPTRLNYTVLGDGVNLASRLEGLTKRYQVPIVVGERTREAGTGFVFRELDKVRVRGKTVPVRIYEPLAREGELSPLDLNLLECWHAALEDFRGRRWSRARVAFEALAEEREYARLTQIYLAYLGGLEARSPGPDWDGAFTLYEK